MPRAQLAESAPTSPRLAVVVATVEGAIEFATPDARRWLRNHFARPLRRGLLPREVCRWLAEDGREAGRESLTVRGKRARLFVRRQRPHPPECVVLLLELSEERNGPATRRDSALTQREAEVLRWIAAGKSNREMAEILGLAPSTVGKHLERIFQKLGVENRTAAASFHAR